MRVADDGSSEPNARSAGPFVEPVNRFHHQKEFLTANARPPAYTATASPSSPNAPPLSINTAAADAAPPARADATCVGRFPATVGSSLHRSSETQTPQPHAGRHHHRCRSAAPPTCQRRSTTVVPTLQHHRRTPPIAPPPPLYLPPTGHGRPTNCSPPPQLHRLTSSVTT